MKKVYIIRISTIDKIYADYMIEANSLFSARRKAKKAFNRDYPNIHSNIRLELQNVDNEKIKEILNIIKKGME